MLPLYEPGAAAGARRRNKRKGKNRAASGAEWNQLSATAMSTSGSTPVTVAGPSTPTPTQPQTQTQTPASNLIPKGPRYPTAFTFVAPLGSSQTHPYSNNREPAHWARPARGMPMHRGSNGFPGPLAFSAERALPAATPTTSPALPVPIFMAQSQVLTPVPRSELNNRGFHQIGDSDAAAAETLSAGQALPRTWATLLHPVPHTPISPMPQSNSSSASPPPDPYALAEEASVLLEVFCQSVNEGAANADHTTNRELIKGARENVKKIWDSLWGGTEEKRPARPLHEDQDPNLMVYSGCVICYSEVAEAVLLPCNHLVLCLECSDGLGIKDRALLRTRANTDEERVKCPLCRTTVSHRIKIFRG